MRILINYIENILKDQVKREFDLKIDKIPFNIPPNSELGDLSSALPIIIAKQSGKNQAEFKLEISDPIIKSTNTANGYLNIFINWNEAFKLIKDFKPNKIYTDSKILVEHTSVNPNKPMHIGHLRNSVVGDTVAKMLTYLGADTTAINYIDDTGLQMAELTYFVETHSKWEEIKSTPQENLVKLLGDYYIQVQKELEANPDERKEVNALYAKIEKQEQPIASQTKELAQIVLTEHTQQLKYLGIDHDLSTWESDLLKDNIVEKTITLLKEKQIIIQREDGDHKGCWVLPDKDNAETNADKIIIKSDGTITYTGKDIAFQLWKFNYWQDNNNNFNESINVVDDRQSYTQDVVSQAMKLLNVDKKMHHLDYQVVALSAKSYEEITGQKADSKIMMMKGRQGIGFDLTDLISNIKKKLAEKNPDNDIDALAKSALRAYILKYTLNQMIVFDLEETLRLDGETGIYLNYTFARASQLINKINCQMSEEIDSSILPESAIKLLKALANFPQAIESFELNYDPQSIIRQAFDICGAFNTFYDDPKTGKIIDLEDAQKQQYLAIISIFKTQLATIFDIIGIEKLEKI